MNLFNVITLQNVHNINRRKCINFLLNGIEFKEIIKIFSIGEDDISRAKRIAGKIIEDCNNYNIGILSIFDQNYPESVKKIVDVPLVLYYKGNFDNTENKIAIVGTRIPLKDSVKKTFYITRELINDNFAIVSGLALGIDTVAHEVCLRYNKYTIAILPSPINNIYPKQNEKLAMDIIDKGGCIISEYAPGKHIEKFFFVQRDRLQAALSSAVIVIETDKNGGAMHTARFCKNYNKVLFCVKPPDDIEYNKNKENFSGNIKLLRDNYTCQIDGSKDILREINEKLLFK